MNDFIKILADRILESTVIKYIPINWQFTDLYFDVDGELLHTKSTFFKHLFHSEKFTFAQSSFAEKLSNPAKFVNCIVVNHLELKLPSTLKLRSAMTTLAGETDG